MTDKNSNNTRSKLTLKLPSKVNNSITENSSQKTSEKKTSNSSVQVTIKGRKPSSPSSNSASKSLNKNELEARFKAISDNNTSEKIEDKEIKTFEILKKAKKTVENVETSSLENQPNNSEINTNKLVDKPTENKVVKDASQDQKQIDENAVFNNNLIDIKIDGFDVRNKIKLSLQIENKQKEEREKLIEEKKKKELEISANLAKSNNDIKKPIKKLNNNSVKNPLAKTNFEEENIKKTNPKENFKNSKFNSRKLTYIISASDDESEEDFEFRKHRKKKFKPQIIQENKEYKKVTREVNLPELITVSELAERMSEKAGDVVKKLFTMGMVVTSNQAIDAETAEIIIHEFGHTSKRVSHSDVENVLDDSQSNEELHFRAPIVTIMGHVDHGKTSLLDALRETDVASGEHGGITQHIGASRIKTKDGKYITFLDTPGHEAFTEMRSRGANITDIVVLVVAADDGVKEQTIEAINHAKAANVPIIVAVNKIDKPQANPQIVKNELLSHNLVSEDLGGDVMFIPVSAKSKTNLDKLEEAILLQAEILELKAPYQGKSSGVVLESRVDANKGVVATMLVQKGTLDVGDLVVVGTSFGKIRKMTDSNLKILKSATPSVPVEVLGLDYAPNAGDKFVEVDEERQAREIISYRVRKEKEEKALKNSAK